MFTSKLKTWIRGETSFKCTIAIFDVETEYKFWHFKIDVGNDEDEEKTNFKCIIKSDSSLENED